MVKAISFSESEIIYPDSDGKPMADNTKQFRWIVTIKENLGSSGFCVEGRRIGIIWVHLNLVEISRGHFGRMRCARAPTIGAIILL
jgi:hypothetical protein